LLIDNTKEFIKKYGEIQSKNLAFQPEWKIDSIIRSISNSKNLEEEKFKFEQKIEWLIQNDSNPFVGYSKELLANTITNEKINSTISAMTNGKFLDSIGVYSNKTSTTEVITDYIDKITGVKI